MRVKMCSLVAEVDLQERQLIPLRENHHRQHHPVQYCSELDRRGFGAARRSSPSTGAVGLGSSSSHNVRESTDAAGRK